MTTASPVEVLAVIRHAVGGIRTYLRDVYPQLAADGYRFTVVAVEGHESHLLQQDLGPHHAQVISVPEQRDSTRLLAAVSRRLAWHRPHIIHSHGFTAGAIASIANLPWGVPHVNTSHSTLSAADFPRPWSGLKARALSSLLGRADVVQSVTFDARRNLIEHLPDLETRTSLSVVVHGVDLGRFTGTDPAPAGPPPALQLPGDRFLFGFLGRPMPEKGFESLIAAVDLLTRDANRPPFLVVVAGDGGYIREYRAHIAARGLSDSFRFVGFVPDAVPLIASLQTVVIPSLQEACCLVAMECLVAGRPIIASRCLGLREIVANTPACVVAPGDAAALADAMRDAMRSRTAWAAAAKAFAPVARDRFDSRRVAAALDACFRGVLRNGPVPPAEAVTSRSAGSSAPPVEPEASRSR